MKIYIDARCFDGAYSGIANYTSDVISKLKIDHDVVLISNRKVSSHGDIHGCKKMELTRWSWLPGTLWVIFVAGFYLDKRSTFLGVSHAVPLLRGGFKRVLVLHDLVHIDFPRTMSTWNRIVSKLFIYLCIQRSNAILAVSETMRSRIQEKYRPKASVRCVYPVLHRKIRKSGSDGRVKKSIDFLYVGAIEPRKNIGKMIAAFDLVYDNFKQLRVTIVTSKTWKLDIATTSRPYVSLISNASSDDLKLLYENTRYGIMPSIYEGFGLQVLDCVDTCGLVANDIPVLREHKRNFEGIKLIDFSDEKEAANNIALFLSAGEEEIIRCKDCTKYEMNGLYGAISKLE